jgi:alpha-amylase
MSKLKLILGTYNNIPVGTAESDIEAVYQGVYKPFLSLLYNFPEIAFTLQYSGALLSWLDKRHSEFTDVLSEMISRKQVELLGGAFYNPILTVIPRSDRLGQIESLTTYLRKRFGRRPRGGWVPELEWEPNLASTLSTCGIDYTFLGEYHFRSAGLCAEDFYRPCITEDQGKTLAVFPLFEDNADKFALEEPEKSLELLRRMFSEEEERIITILVDGERFGGCEGSRKACYGEKGLERFLDLVRNSAEWLEPIHPARYLRLYPPHHKAYFPCGSHDELMSAALSPEQHEEFRQLKEILKTQKKNSGPFFGGVFFRRFLTRYPESNLLYAKMQYTHILVNQIKGDKYRKSSALEELWKGQSGSVYWPEPRGGLYNNGLRKTAYRSLISAEKVTREKGVFIPSIVTADFDMDSRIEYLFQGNEMNAYIHTLGARLFELDYLPVSWNYLDTMARHHEYYHVADESGRGCDRYSRKTFIDHFFSADATVEDFDRMTYREEGRFIDAPYEVIKCDRDHSELVLECSAPVSGAFGSCIVKIVKKFIFKRASINLYYSLKNQSETPLSVIFGSELNFSFLSKEVDSLKLFRREGNEKVLLSPEKTELANVTEMFFEDVANDVRISFSTLEPGATWSLPVETSSLGVSGLLTAYQSSCIVPRWKIDLESQGAWENRISLRMDPL